MLHPLCAAARERYRRSDRVLLGRAILVAASLFTATVTAEPRDGLSGPLLEELRAGGFVIYFRHTATVHDSDGNTVEDLEHCETQRNLSLKGRAEAARVGQAIKALAIPVGTVVSSPYCRTKETALLAFGRLVEDANLGFVVGTNAGETKRLAQALRLRLTTMPEKGSNSVIVSHSANLFEAAGIFAKPEGVAYVFRPLADGRFEAVARILPEDWSNASRQEAPLQARAKGVAVR